MSIATDVAAIREAIYGKDVREAIADAILDIDGRVVGEGAVSYLQDQTLTTTQQGRARTNINAAGLNEAVIFSGGQALTTAQQAQARTNIQAAGLDEAVLYSAAQSLSISQQAQARENIGAASESAYTYLRTITLASAGWTDNEQTISLDAILGDVTAQYIRAMPATASMPQYMACGVGLYSQATGTLTFQCLSAPTADLTVYVLITEVQ